MGKAGMLHGMRRKCYRTLPEKSAERKSDKVADMVKQIKDHLEIVEGKLAIILNFIITCMEISFWKIAQVISTSCEWATTICKMLVASKPGRFCKGDVDIDTFNVKKKTLIKSLRITRGVLVKWNRDRFRDEMARRRGYETVSTSASCFKSFWQGNQTGVDRHDNIAGISTPPSEKEKVHAIPRLLLPPPPQQQQQQQQHHHHHHHQQQQQQHHQQQRAAAADSASP